MENKIVYNFINDFAASEINNKVTIISTIFLFLKWRRSIISSTHFLKVKNVSYYLQNCVPRPHLGQQSTRPSLKNPATKQEFMTPTLARASTLVRLLKRAVPAEAIRRQVESLMQTTRAKPFYQSHSFSVLQFCCVFYTATGDRNFSVIIYIISCVFIQKHKILGTTGWLSNTKDGLSTLFVGSDISTNTVVPGVFKSLNTSRQDLCGAIWHIRFKSVLGI